MSISRRNLIRSCVATGVAAEIAVVATGCTVSADSAGPDPAQSDLPREPRSSAVNPYDHGAVGDGKADDTAALQSAYQRAADTGGYVELTRGRYFIPGHLHMEHAGVSLVSRGGVGVIGGGEVRVGPESYSGEKYGVDYSGTEVSGLTFDYGDDYGDGRCLVLRNVRGLNVFRNVFMSGGKGIAVETLDGNDTFHTTALLRISSNRFSTLRYGVYGDSDRWDRFSDWQITDNYFNFCSDTSVWISSTTDGTSGGLDGLTFAGNFMFSQTYTHGLRKDVLFGGKRHNLKLGKSNWVSMSGNNFFEAGLSAICLDEPQNFSIVGNHVAWPGQRELGDCVEIRGGKPTGIIEGNTFSLWTRAAIGLYDVADASNVVVGQNAWDWEPSPNSWTGEGELPGYRIFTSASGNGVPVVRDFQPTGAFDNLSGKQFTQSRDIKSPRGGVTGASQRGCRVSGRVEVFSLTDIVDRPHYGGLLTITACNSSDNSLMATYLLFVSSQGSKCSVIESGGYTDGAEVGHPSFTWALDGSILVATPIENVDGTFDFDAVAIGAASLS